MKTFNQFIQEGYQERVQKTADAVAQHASNIGKFDKLEDMLTSIRNNGTVETRFPSDHPAHREFVVDVLKKLKAPYTKHLKSWPKTASDDTSEEKLRKLFSKFERHAGDTFPDGDPHDAIYSYMKKNGHKPADLNKAVRKYGGAKSSHHYMAQMWDGYAADNPKNDLNVSKKNNPWK